MDSLLNVQYSRQSSAKQNQRFLLLFLEKEELHQLATQLADKVSGG
jgi:hypothetical protein